LATGKTALVTGAARGIGKAVALELVRRGFHVAVNDIVPEERTETILADFAEAGGGRALYVRADISRAEEREAMVSRLRGEFGRLDLLVNNAGIAPRKRLDLLEATEESFDEVLAVNLKGPYFLTQLVARWMIELRGKLDGYEPRIVNISSISAYTSSPARGEYCVSKAGVSMMTKLYADRLAEFGIGVYEIRPGIIRTDMTAPVREKYDRLIAEGLTPIRRWGEPRDIALAVAAIAEGYLPFSTGEVINVDGGFHLRRL